ncbi:hypothetical protein DITRI_Ditri09bG0130900 [Diplodiscus trichospermus]
MTFLPPPPPPPPQHLPPPFFHYHRHWCKPYSMIADNLRLPLEVANFIQTQAIFYSVKIFDSNPDILSAVANIN